MGLIDRLTALGRGSVDRALSKAEEIAGLRKPEAPFEQATQHPISEVPFFQDDVDWSEFGQFLSKGARAVEPIDVGKPAHEPKALLYDPFQFVSLLGFKERPTGLAYSILDQMALRNHIIQAIIRTRLSQIAQHCRVQEDSHAIGFKVQHRDKKSNLSAAGRRRAQEIERALILTTTGEPGLGRDGFEAFTRKVMRDSLVFDQYDFEIIPSRRGKPHSWHAVDAKSIRLADTTETFFDAGSEKTVRCVQVLDGQVIREWPADEMAFVIRNPNSSLQSHGYGFSELEMMIHVITALLWAFQYNQKFFSQGAGQKGILNFKGQVSGRQLAAFRRFFYQMLSGVDGAWKTPILNAEQGAEWIPMHSTNRDMEFSAWMDHLIKIATSIYLMDPTEVGFKYGNEGDRSLFESANDQKITQSKDKGLKPLLGGYATALNKYIVQRLDPDFEMRFLGMDALTPKEQAELVELQGRVYLMVDEIREREGLQPLANGEGQVINSPTWMQYKQSKDAAAQEAAAQAAGGPGAEGSEVAPGPSPEAAQGPDAGPGPGEVEGPAPKQKDDEGFDIEGALSQLKGQTSKLQKSIIVSWEL